MERNANHIIPSYCYLQVSCRSLVDRCSSVGSCKPQIYYYYFYYCYFFIFLARMLRVQICALSQESLSYCASPICGSNGEICVLRCYDNLVKHLVTNFQGIIKTLRRPPHWPSDVSKPYCRGLHSRHFHNFKSGLDLKWGPPRTVV